MPKPFSRSYTAFADWAKREDPGDNPSDEGLAHFGQKGGEFCGIEDNHDLILVSEAIGGSGMSMGQVALIALMIGFKAGAESMYEHGRRHDEPLA